MHLDDAAARADRERGSAAPAAVAAAAERLNYRDFLTVALIIDKRRDCSPTTGSTSTIPSVKLGRIQNFKNWSPTWCPDPPKTCLGLEYFCFEGDGLWTMSDADLIALGATRDRADRPARRRRRSSTAAWSGCPRRTRSTTRATEAPGRRPRLARRLLEPAAGRPQRHAQVQQPGSLDDDRPAGRRRTCSASTTTSGRSTPTPNTTRSQQVDLRDVHADLPELDATQPRVPQALPERA